MITTKYVREHVDALRISIKRRKSKFPLDELLKIDEDWRNLKTKLQELQTKRNKESLEISELKKKGVDTKDKIASLASTKAEIEKIEKELPEYEEKINELLSSLPNILQDSVPDGNSSEDNPVLRTWGTIRNKTTPTHEEILTKMNLIDIERASKISGARFYFLKRDMVLLEQSLLRFGLDELVKKNYTPVVTPYMMRESYYKKTVDIAQFEDALYRVADPEEVKGREDYEKLEESLFLIATAEHPIAAMYADEIIPTKDLPLKYVGISPCFRREAGSHGKDTKGIFRLHQFNKVEQFIFSTEEDTWKHFEELQKNSEELWQKLDIPYRVIEICTGDIGSRAAKAYDIEAYMPSSQTYREAGSCSNLLDWQSMRLNIRYDDKGERKYVHTLNNTAFASPRALIYIIENYLNSDGSINVPNVLIPYMGKSKIV
ncbi:MAG: serine--tRNA ligase [Candidatus Micrarchaeia archaeon]